MGDPRRAPARRLAAGSAPVLYDIIDETMHVRWGQKWVPELMKFQNETKDLPDIIDECRQAVLENSLAPAQRISAQSAK